MIAIAVLTIVEIVRRRFALPAILGIAAFAALSAWGFHSLHAGRGATARPLTPLEAREAAAFLLPLLAYFFSFVLAFAAAMLAATTLSAEVESGVLLPVLARPISRGAVVAGKAAGLTVVLCAFAALFGILEFGVVFLTTGFVAPHPVLAVAGLAGTGIVMMVFTLALGSRLGAIASGLIAVLCFGVAWIAGIADGLAVAYKNEALVHAGTAASLLLPTDALWRAAVYQLEPAMLVSQLEKHGGWPGPFFVIAPPPLAMILWSAAWVAVVLAVAASSFSTRDV
jgi:ABC-type transport system involved in multi-copper enzyme maturation permease subunit